MALLKLSKVRDEDLLSNDVDNTEDRFVQMPMAQKKDTEAPRMANTIVAHELLGEGSRMNSKIENYLNAQQLISGKAQAEQLLLELNCAAQINRGPDGVFEGSRLHWDMLLNRDETIFPSDYLNFDAKMKR